MNTESFGNEYAIELKTETPASRKCLERVPEKLFDWSPHEKSMKMGYLALLVASMPRWITTMIKDSEIDFATFKQHMPATTAELVAHLDESVQEAVNALRTISDKELAEPFYLKNQGKTVFTSPKKDNIRSTINHWVHHRGQLTVYLRLNNISVPSIYGPSADDRAFM